MSKREMLDRVLRSLPEERLDQLLDFAEFLQFKEEHDAWKQVRVASFARCYGPDEPEYTEADLKPENRP